MDATWGLFLSLFKTNQAKWHPHNHTSKLLGFFGPHNGGALASCNPQL